ncbi:hypothetical protein BAZSYMB_GCONTIG00778_0 [Bathymodiolus azoricus thioautotrophic gill symbiont]|uniref:Uncharacterized protein n=1 Tax=Bathymodiolus azoricus thioautotrophic gill symbiont TaxID=235205 RepID=A0A1H6L2G8_9GAMM|nr:hypothetical protein BAZSYMB_GCONTIG00778_0 [Bathymodiolus azoricus thioautotrophic gill symbiont]SEH82336.1 hypothetical protein BAZSYMA_ACONTIG00136_0 [Bathymodiolus azoricus thioautotrophic gill symbiont]
MMLPQPSPAFLKCHSMATAIINSSHSKLLATMPACGFGLLMERMVVSCTSTTIKRRSKPIIVPSVLVFSIFMRSNLIGRTSDFIQRFNVFCLT